jgi:hypothetical protein
MGFGGSSSNSQQQSNSNSQSQSINQAYPEINSTFSPQATTGVQSNNAIADLLGLNGEVSQSDGFNNYLNSSAYKFTRDQGIEGINSNNASKGLLDSGSALKAITSYSSNLANQFLNQYISNLQGLGQQGLGAGQVITSAGNTANSQGTSYSTGTSSGKSSSFSLG